MSGKLDRVRWDPNERVDIPDQRALTSSIAAHMHATVAELVNRSNRVLLSGFAVTVKDASTLTVTRGTGGAFIGVDPDTVAEGALLNDVQGATSRDVSFAGLANGTYSVWLKLTVTDGAQDNRAFWDPGTDAEFVALMDTRELVDWAVTASTTDPSVLSPPEYQAIASVVWNGAFSNLTDTRFTLFEGKLDEVQSETGISDYDRSTDRSTKHLTRLVSFTTALLREIQDIKSNYWNHDGAAGGQAWYTALPTGLSLRSAQDVFATVGDGSNSFGTYNADDEAAGYDVDASLAIQAAIDAANAEGGGIIVIKPGVYVCKSTITFPATKTDKITILGAGQEATLLDWDVSTPAASLFQMAPTGTKTRVAVENLTIRYNNTTGDTNMINVDLSGLSSENMELVEVTDVQFLSTASSPINTAISVTGGSSTAPLLRLLIERCRFGNVEQGVVADWVSEQLLMRGCSGTVGSRGAILTNCTGIQLTHCQLQGDSTRLAILYVKEGCSRITISGLVLQNLGLYLQGCTDTTVSGCTSESAGASTRPFSLWNCSRTTFVGNWGVSNNVGVVPFSVGGSASFNNISVSGNVFLSDNYGIQVFPTSGVRSYNVSVVGNVIAERTYDSGSGTLGTLGIDIQRISGATVGGNLVFRVGSAGISADNCDAISIANNVVLDDDRAGGQDIADRIVRDGIDIRSLCVRASVSGNIVHGTTERGIIVNANDSTVTGNVIAGVTGGTVKGGLELGGVDLLVTGNAVIDCAGYGVSVGVDRISITNCIINSPTLEGLKLVGVEDCSFTDVLVQNAGTKGVDASNTKSTVTNRFTNVVSSVAGDIGFDMSGRFLMANCASYNPTKEALNTSANAIAVLTNFNVVGVTNGGTSTYGVVFGSGTDISWTGGHVAVHPTTPATIGIRTDGSGCRGAISGVYLLGAAGMTIGISGNGRMKFIGCTVDNFGETGISVSGATGGTDAATAIGCTVINGPTSGGFRCIRVQGSAGAIGCDVHPGATTIGIIAITGNGGTSLIKGNTIHGSTGSTTVIDVTNTDGALITDNRSPGLAGLIDLNFVGGDCIVLGNILGGTGGDGPVNDKGASTLPATLSLYNF